MKALFVIPARGGSKGIPRKNIKNLNGKPLIYYSIDIARKFTDDCNICLSTDDDEIIRIAKEYGLNIPFRRPLSLANDYASTSDVLLHAIRYYERKGIQYDSVVLLQPTSPFRRVDDVAKAIRLYSEEEKKVDMVVSVKEAENNPYYGTYEEDGLGYLNVCKGDGTFTRRQDAPKVWVNTGTIYVINVESLKRNSLSQLKYKKKIIVDEYSAIDLDTMFDWKMAELLVQEKLVNI